MKKVNIYKGSIQSYDEKVGRDKWNKGEILFKKKRISVNVVEGEGEGIFQYDGKLCMYEKQYLQMKKEEEERKKQSKKDEKHQYDDFVYGDDNWMWENDDWRYE